MSALPVITAIGGISPAGRTACHHGFHRLVMDALDSATRERTLNALGSVMPGTAGADALLHGTLIRRLERNLFDADKVGIHVNARASAPLVLDMRDMDLPNPLPAHWQVTPLGDKRSRIAIPAGAELLLPATRSSRVQSAGQLPSGFDPAALYPSRHHPRALQMAVFGASDMLGMLGIDWSVIQQRLAPQEIAVYASSAMSQLDENGFGGVLRSPALGRRVTSKQLPLGFGGMSADFINAYILGTAGGTGGMLGACATFLYNLQLAVNDIRSGRRRLVVVGTSEAPLVPEVIEGYRAMGALGEDETLCQLDNSESADHRRACRPFGFNAGFTIAESAQFAVIMDDALALELGADILGAVPDVFVHADGPKKSISAPGVGNYLTMSRAAALARQLLGEKGLRENTFVHAHGTGTPQNRTTESEVLDRVAKAFGISHWPVTAIKCYVGHSLGSAGGDQLAAALGTFASGILPGIATLDQVAPDVHADRLILSQAHTRPANMDAALINAKGFGGNNATALVLSPDRTRALLRTRHGDNTLHAWQDRVQGTREAIAAWDTRASAGQTRPAYHFGEGVLDGNDLDVTDRHVRLPGWDQAVPLEDDEGYAGYL
ncbi:MAG: beta-ketoacyl synthase [Alcanivorax sp.]|nr:beta-ketoacyl synthase [Alcanivorax sp.]